MLFNLRHLGDEALHLKGELPVEALELGGFDELIQARRPLSYDLEVQRLDQAVLVQGVLELALDCECVRCLAPFEQTLRLQAWACHLPLAGEGKVLVTNDCVDLTPYIREDIVLAFPQHPLCRPECGGLASSQQKLEVEPGAAGEAAPASTAWAALDKLKL